MRLLVSPSTKHEHPATSVCDLSAKRGRVSTDPAPLHSIRSSDEPPSVARVGWAAARPARRKPGALAPTRRRAATTTSGRSLQLPCLARLRVVTLATKIRENPRLLHLLLEALERPVEAIV